jgi:predicted 3-demethylubiquinone-9 3-methyltransferase (glyoxalase superfamily)
MSGGSYTQNPWSGIAYQTEWLKEKSGVSFSVLVDELERLTAVAKSKIAQIRSKRSAMSIADMFDLQMAMNKLSQFSEMSTSLIQSMNTAISTMARNIKG